MLMTKKGGIYTTEETIHLSRCCFNFFFFFFYWRGKTYFFFLSLSITRRGKIGESYKFKYLTEIVIHFEII